MEKQTDDIVSSIQSLLKLLRNSQFDKEFIDVVVKIQSVVKDIIQTTSTSLKGEDEVIHLLEKSGNNLKHLCDLMMNETEKPSKQQLASASYEVAKYTKELVGLFD